MREPDLEVVNRSLSVTVQKVQAENSSLRKALYEAAAQLERAGWYSSAEKAREAAQ